MTDLKKYYSDYLVSCIHKQCRSSKLHVDKYRQVFSNNRNVANFSLSFKELIFTPGIKCAEGSHFNDLDDNVYLDMSMGFGVHLFGHRPQFLENVFIEQIKKGISLGPIFEDAAHVAALIHELTGNERCAFYNTGTEAVMVAMRLARAAIKKDKVVIFAGSYHGTHDSLLGIKTDNETHLLISTVPGISQNAVNKTMILEYGSPLSIKIIRQFANEIGAVLIEPVMSRHPELANEEFLHLLRDICTRQDIALIFDEVITGFRAGNNGAAGVFNIQPDITTYGKIAGGGIPIGIVAGKSRFMDMIDGGQWRFGDNSAPQTNTTFTAGTFNHHPLAMAAAKTTLQYLKDHNGEIQTGLDKRTAAMCSELNVFYEENGFPVSMVNFSSLFRFSLKGNHKLLFYSLLKEGIYIWEGRNCFISTAHSEKDLEFFKERVKKCCFELEAAGIMHVKRTKKIIDKDFELRGGIKVNALLDMEALAYACYYLFTAIPKLRASSCILASETPLNMNAGVFAVRIFRDKQQTLIQVTAERAICDGWSLLLFFKYLARSYNTLKSGRSLPLIDHESETAISPGKKDNGIYYRTADSLQVILPYQMVPEKKKKRLFSSLLAEFHQSLSTCAPGIPCIAINRISVPVAGQLLSRKINVFGQCTVYKQVSIPEAPFADHNEKINLIEVQMKNVNGNGNCPGKNHADVLFNLDNLNFELDFMGNKASFLSMEDNVTGYPLVCNISRLNTDLVISLKYAKNEFTEEQVKKILDDYTNRIKQNME